MKIRIKEDEISSFIAQVKPQMSAFIDGMQDAIEDKSTEQKEGIVTTASIALALPAILGIIARLGKSLSSIVKRTIGTKPTDQNDADKYFNQMSRIADELHHLYQKPIELVVRKFVKDEDKAKKISSFIFHIIIAILFIASGITAIKALKSKEISLATLETALSAVKGGEVKNYITKLLA
jgi:hypothetical protein